MDSRLAGLEVAVDRDIAGLKVLQEAVQEDTGDLLAKGRAARQVLLALMGGGGEVELFANNMLMVDRTAPHFIQKNSPVSL